MKILYCKCFGLGNAVMAMPAIKALKSMGHEVDVLIGNTPDDVGAFDVMRELKEQGIVDFVWNTHVPLITEYDLAILAIPFDGRWKNGVHFQAKEVVDGRTRPDPSTVGLVSWKKHEIEYQMDNIRELGYVGEIPDTSFFSSFYPDISIYPRRIYVGVGYKKDEMGFWKIKHWGNENYARFIRRILLEYPDCAIVASGDMGDFRFSLKPIFDLVNYERFFIETCSLARSFYLLETCDAYIGNDTGMMHVAASMGKKTMGLFFMENSLTKSAPWGQRQNCIEAVGRELSPEEVFQKWKEIS